MSDGKFGQDMDTSVSHTIVCEVGVAGIDGAGSISVGKDCTQPGGGREGGREGRTWYEHVRIYELTITYLGDSR